MIPYTKDIAIHYSKGDILYNNLDHKPIFDELCARTKEVLQWS